jgi:hypothetical protein
LFVQQTVVPGVISTLDGSNAKSTMLTPTSPLSQAVGLDEAWPNAGSTPRKTAASAATNASNPSGSPLLIPTARTITVSHLGTKSGCRNVRGDA